MTMNKDPFAPAPEAAQAEKEMEMLLWNSLVRLIRRWQAYRRTYNELMRLDDHQLADISVSRGEIEGIARDTARSAR